MFLTRRFAVRYFHPTQTTKFLTRSILLSAPKPANTTEKEVPLDYTVDDIPGFRAPGQIPTNYEIATGKERWEVLKELRGEEPWEDMQPLVMTHKGTKTNPVKLSGYDPVFYLGCSGYPANSHSTVFLTLNGKHPFDRCPECGVVYKYNQLQVEGDHH